MLCGWECLALAVAFQCGTWLRTVADEKPSACAPHVNVHDAINVHATPGGLLSPSLSGKAMHPIKLQHLRVYVPEM